RARARGEPDFESDPFLYDGEDDYPDELFTKLDRWDDSKPSPFIDKAFLSSLQLKAGSSFDKYNKEAITIAQRAGITVPSVESVADIAGLDIDEKVAEHITACNSAPIHVSLMNEESAMDFDASNRSDCLKHWEDFLDAETQKV